GASRRSRRLLRPSACSDLAPPLAFERAIGAPGAIERIELCQILGGKGEVEDRSVLGDSLAMRRLRDHRNAPLDAPAQQNLRGRAAVALCKSRDRVARQV